MVECARWGPVGASAVCPNCSPSRREGRQRASRFVVLRARSGRRSINSPPQKMTISTRVSYCSGGTEILTRIESHSLAGWCAREGSLIRTFQDQDAVSEISHFIREFNCIGALPFIS